MKRTVILLVAASILSGCSILANANKIQLAQAAGKALTAASLSDAQIAQLSSQSIAHLDQTNVIDHGEYEKRLARVMSGVRDIEGIPVNFKVYRTKEINAFASGDGSIRVYSGLMDVMDDSELAAIIGHEMGHVVHKDTKVMMQKAYLASAARDVISSAGGRIGVISQSLVGDLAENFVSAQFSQKQEFAADEYGFEFSVKRGCSPYSMHNALNKLVNLSKGSQAPQLVKMFSSHPDSEERAERMKEKADAYSRQTGTVSHP